MNYGLAMKILETFDNAINERLDFRGCERLPGSDDFIERFALAQFEKDVNVVFIFEIMEEFDNIFVVQSFVEPDFV